MYMRDWADQDFEWYRAAWVECGELIEHYGYKWWKKQEPDLEQVRLEVIDIWHFGLSALFRDGKDIEQIAGEIAAELAALRAKRPGRARCNRSAGPAFPADPKLFTLPLLGPDAGRRAGFRQPYTAPTSARMC